MEADIMQEAGAAAYLPKGSPLERLLDAILAEPVAAT